MSDVNKPTYGDRSFAAGAPLPGQRVRVNQAFPASIPNKRTAVIRAGKLVGTTTVVNTPAPVTSGGGSTTTIINQSGPISGVSTQHTAGQILGGDRIVTIQGDGNAYYADNSTLADTARTIGITTASAAMGALVTVQETGEYTEPTWTWTPGLPMFLGVNGTLTQTPPTTGFLLCLGVATAATSILIRIAPAIILA